MASLQGSPEQDHGRDIQLSVSNSDALAARLLNEGLVLTALELHAELLERGKEVPRLRDYFSNPANFESARVEPIPAGTLKRTGSEQTFDSLDWARYSDDGQTQADDRVAGLEFELRKAQDTIKSLRSDLTQVTECSNTLTVEELTPADDPASSSLIKSHEKKAINHLVNEYLLAHDYKLSSVTFAEENENQDFENWDDVGLNIPKPPPLLLLYRDFGQHVGPPQKDTADGCCQVQLVDERRMADLELELITMEQEAASCRSKLEDEVEARKEDHEKFQVLESTIEELKSSLNEQTALREKAEQDLESVSFSRTGFHSNKNGLGGHPIGMENSASVELLQPQHASPKTDLERPVPSKFREYLIRTSLQVKEDDRIVTELSNMAHPQHEDTILMIGRSLPHIVPNVLLGKREELLPLILCAANMHPDPKERDGLLRMLFNLIKRPSKEQRDLILSGCLTFARYNGEEKVEGELLPQCWEQIDNRHHERRILVAQTCGCLIPYLSSSLCGSLLLSMLSQMLFDEKVQEVRVAIIHSLGVLVSFIGNPDKYAQVADLYMRVLSDPARPVQEEALLVLLPSVALWSLNVGKLIPSLSTPLLNQLESSVSHSSESFANAEEEERFTSAARHLTCLLPYLYMNTVQSMDRKHEENEEGVGQLQTRPGSLIVDSLSDLQSATEHVCEDWQEVKALSESFQERISEEWFAPWDSYTHIVEEMLPAIVRLSVSLKAHQQPLLSQLSLILTRVSSLFGKRFMSLTAVSLFTKEMERSEAVFSSGVPIVLCTGVYTSDLGQWKEELAAFLSNILGTVALGESVPREGLWNTFKELSNNPEHHTLLLDVLWQNLLHAEPKVKSTVGLLFEMFVHPVSEEILSQKVIPALITLAHDPDVFVKASSVEALGSIVETTQNRELLDKVYMQFNAYFEDSMGSPGQGHLHSQLIQTFGKVGPNVEPKFRNEVVLPKLALMAAANNHRPSTSSTPSLSAGRLEIAQQLFEAYSTFSCCFIPPEVVKQSFLPGLRAVAADMRVLAPEHLPVIASMIKELEAQTETQTPLPVGATASASSSDSPSKSHNYGGRMFSKIKDRNSRVSNLFSKKK